MFGLGKNRSSAGRLARAAGLAGFIAIASVGSADAQQTGGVEGRVTGAAKEPIHAALVQVIGTGKSVQTSPDGRYRIEGIPAGQYTVAVRAIGWKTARIPVAVTAGSVVVVDASLTNDAVVLSDVVVSVSREAQSRSEATTSVGVVDRTVLEQARPHHPAEIVARVPGAWVANLSGEGHFTAIRQPITTKPMYAYLEDGVPTRSTGFFNHNALYEVNLPGAERVEVIKGPGSALYGSDAIGGVVNSYTRAPSDRPSGELFVEGGRFGYARVLGTASNAWGSNGLRADLNLTRSDSYRDGAPYARQSGTVRWDHRLSDAASLKTVVAFSHIDQPGDGGSDVTQADFDARPTANYTPIAYRRVLAVRASSSLERQSGLSHFTATVYGRHNRLELMPSWQLSFDPQIWDSKNQSVGLMGRYRQTVLPLRANLSAGVDLEVSPGSRMEQAILPVRDGAFFRDYTPGVVQYDYDVTFWQTSPYVQAEVNPAAGLRLDLGLRFDNVGFDYDTRLDPIATGPHRRPASTGVSYQRLSPKLGASFEVTRGLNLFASYRAAFRAPSESQLFRQGSALNTIDLAPVKADNYEAGTRVALGSRVSFEATVYQLDIEDDILTLTDPVTGLRSASNAGATRHRGVELGAAVEPVRGLRIDGSWTVTKQEYLEWRPSAALDYSGNEIEIAPRDMGRVGATLTPRAFGRGHLAAEWLHMGSYWMDPQNTEKYAGHDVFSVSGSLPVTAQFDVVGRVHNIGDTRFAETSSYTALQGRRYRPGPPRTFYLGLQYRFGAQGG
ncbi:MAG: TonB-dependent receptor [Gemmatimonadales bacterium]|nr:TonB-dependent receptor [Gemmatimonadales bacterium]